MNKKIAFFRYKEGENLMFELRIVKIGVKAAFFDEFVVSAFFDNIAVFHNENKVGVLYCG